MESHTPSLGSPQESAITSSKPLLSVELPPKLDEFHRLAVKYYGPLKKIAELSDDHQKNFTSAGANFLKATDFLTLAALRANAENLSKSE